MSNKAIVIGIAGGTNSGKSTFVRFISEYFGNKISLLSHDFYYKRHDELAYEERCKCNYDHPDAFDTDLMIQHIQELKEGKSIKHPVYDFTQHNRSNEEVEVKPSRVIVVEGILIFASEELRNLCDIKIFIDAPADIRILRRVKRDVAKRGRTIESVMAQYLDTVRPMHELYVEPSKAYADLIVPQGGKNKIALDLICSKIDKLLVES